MDFEFYLIINLNIDFVQLYPFFDENKSTFSNFSFVIQKLSKFKYSVKIKT